MIGLLDRIGLTKEAKKTTNDSITRSFDGIAEKMEAAIAGEGADHSGTKKAESSVFWPGSTEDDPKHAINVEYSQAEDGSTIIGIDTGAAMGWMINGDPVVTPDPTYGGRTILERSPQGDLSIDVNGNGRVVPLHEVGAIDSTLLAPLLDGIQQDIGQGHNKIYPVAAQQLHQEAA